ncbi:CLUMA_CG010731, isoform A [Clunio marinus]|uniref:CLUMA_CG010731, isoform A n=1 Tax=Clunio marinus TaxID=568069 RepID=A0A1J1IAV1_9DIPT|nr:CLUMA_CG010731, isoform A [Clunio marinus]
MGKQTENNSRSNTEPDDDYELKVLIDKCNVCHSNSGTDHHKLCKHHANIMPKPNSTESSTTNFQDPVLVNSSNSNLNSRMIESNERNVKKKVQIDDECDSIGDLIGHYGKWQFVMTILLSLFQVPNTFHIFSPTFQAADKDFWCKRPPNLLSNVTSIEAWRDVSNSTENCYRYDYEWSTLSSRQINENYSIPNTTKMIECQEWEFNMTDGLGNTWNSEWNLVCDKKYLKIVAEMIFLIGVATGGIISGMLSDKFGRKKMLFISAVFQSFFGLALYFVESFEIYLVLRALLGIASVSVTYSGLILAIEYVDGVWRTIAGMYNLFPLPLSYIMISGIAYLTQDYKYLQLCIGLPGVFLCLLWFVVPESPRWLLCKGRVSEVKQIIKKAAHFNGRELPENLDKYLKPPCNAEESESGVIELFRTKYLRRVTFCFLCIWFTMNLVYYGLVLNMNSFGGNIYVNSALAGLVEIPAIGIAMYIIMKTGKKWLFSATFLATGISCFFATIFEGNVHMLWLKITFVMIGKFTISAGNTIMPVYTAELYPTSIRNIGVGACNVAAGMALVLTPALSELVMSELKSFEIWKKLCKLFTFVFIWSLNMEDASIEVPPQVQWNRSQAYLANCLQISDKNKFDKSSIFTIGGNSQIGLVANSESGDSEDNEDESDIISEYIGHIGPWQLLWAIIMCLFQFPTTFHIFALVFQAAPKDFWCSRPENLKMISVDLWRNLTQPQDQCTILNAPYATLDAFTFSDFFANTSNIELSKCKSWEFDMSLIGKTLISEWNLVCDRLYLGSVVESCFLAGAGLGSVTSGWISDQHGRKNTLMTFASIQLVAGIMLGMCASLELYMMLRVIIGFCSMAVVVVSFVLCVELVSGKWRTIIGIMNIFPVAIAYIVCAGISYLTYNWRTMQFVITFPTLLLLCLWPSMPESPRWLLARGKIDELAVIIEKASVWNKRKLPRNFKKTLNVSQADTERRVSIFDLFQKGYKRTTFLMTIIWFSIILIYFGITLHMSSLGGNVYINTIIAGSVEACSIAFSVLVVLKLGLRVNLFIYLIIAGAACLLINLARADNLFLTIGLAMIVKISVGACNALIPTYTAEQYPVYMRNLGIGAGNFAAGFALVLVPYIFLLEHIDIHLPMSIMGVVGGIGGISILLIKKKSMKKPQTFTRPDTPHVNNGYVFYCLATTLAQFDGPIPPRLNIPGAIPLPVLRGNQQGRALGGQQIKVRRPQRPQPVITEARFIDEAKPVTEEAEDEYVQHQPAQPAPPRALFTSEPQDNYQSQEQSNAQRFNIERPRPAPQRNIPQPQPQRPRAQIYDEPRAQQKPHHSDDKPKKPVAQILRKYREENPDGSITWGFENDDGSFKEETIGIDCITRGIYGYVDPDGEKREYKYETGILCDPDKRDQEEEEDIESEDFLANLKAQQQAKRPQQGQQFYRN